nr:hypothetical protein BaRGS_003133 [Batillaria attramentaria]
MTEKLPEKEKKRRPTHTRNIHCPPRLVRRRVNMSTVNEVKKHMKDTWRKESETEGRGMVVFRSRVDIVVCTLVCVIRNVFVVMLDTFLFSAISENKVVL